MASLKGSLNNSLAAFFILNADTRHCSRKVLPRVSLPLQNEIFMCSLERTTLPPSLLSSPVFPTWKYPLSECPEKPRFKKSYALSLELALKPGYCIPKRFRGGGGGLPASLVITDLHNFWMLLPLSTQHFIPSRVRQVFFPSVFFRVLPVLLLAE